MYPTCALPVTTLSSGSENKVGKNRSLVAQLLHRAQVYKDKHLNITVTVTGSNLVLFVIYEQQSDKRALKDVWIIWPNVFPSSFILFDSQSTKATNNNIPIFSHI